MAGQKARRALSRGPRACRRPASRARRHRHAMCETGERHRRARTAARGEIVVRCLAVDRGFWSHDHFRATPPAAPRFTRAAMLRSRPARCRRRLHRAAQHVVSGRRNLPPSMAHRSPTSSTRRSALVRAGIAQIEQGRLFDIAANSSRPGSPAPRRPGRHRAASIRVFAFFFSGDGAPPCRRAGPTMAAAATLDHSRSISGPFIVGAARLPVARLCGSKGRSRHWIARPSKDLGSGHSLKLEPAAGSGRR